MSHSGTRVAAVAVAALLPLAGCTPAEEPTGTPKPSASSPAPSPSPTTASPTPSPSPSPSPTYSPEQQAAVETVLEFFRLWTLLGSDPDEEFQPLANITQDEVQRMVHGDLEHMRRQGIIQTGAAALRVVDVAEMPPNDSHEPRLQVAVCSDSTNVDYVNAETGESVLGGDRAYHVYWQFELVYVNDYVWRLADGFSEVRDPCP